MGKRNNKPATQSVGQTQQREAVVQGRSLSPYQLRYTTTDANQVPKKRK
ncbi:MAG: hypothetical protein LBJ00_02480 [Planctomycetaceae bacterium]|nr:hypothetical protein [Planctomycetaceae bacterium]